MSRESAVTTNSLIEQLVSRASGAEAGSGNRIEILLDSTENFPAWEAAMLAAEESICIEMYIFADNAFGRRVRDILLEKLSQGVTVVLAYDWLGCLPAHLTGFFRPLREAGAHITAYNPPGLSLGLGMISRNHRKSIIIDEQTAFVGGLCISSAWEGDPNRGIAPWRDTGLRIDGPAVHDIMAAFADTLASQGKSLPATLKNYERGTLDPCGDIQARVLATTPDNTNTVRLDLNLIGLARDNLWITDAYFMPTRMYTQALINAAAAGVDAALINHYFGGKEKLFYAVVTYTINMDEVTTMLTTTPRKQLGESIIRYAETLWTSPAGQSYLAALRHAIASNATATWSIISDAILPLAEHILDPDDPHRETRIALIISQISGVATTRYLIGIEPMASLDTETLVKTVGPTLQRYIDGDLT